MLIGPLQVERVGKVTVVRIAEKRLLQEREVSELSNGLLRLAGDSGPTRMLVDFGAVVSLTSSVLSSLLRLRKCLRERGGRLAVCGLRPEVREVFALAGLEDTLNVYPTEKEALLSFQGAKA